MNKTLYALFVSMLIVAACDSQPAPAQRATSLPSSTLDTASANPTSALHPQRGASVGDLTSMATSTSSPTPRPTATPTPIPTATPLPEVRLQQAAQAVHDGDYDTAIQQYQAMLGLGRSEPAAIELATTQSRAGYLTDAIDSFQRFIDQYGTSDRVAEAWFGLGEAYFAQEDWTKSIDAYQKYLDLRPNFITSYVQERIGDANVQLGDLDPAAGAYAAAIASAVNVSDAAGLREKLALTYRQLKNYSAALEQYDAILSFAQQPAYRAQVHVPKRADVDRFRRHRSGLSALRRSRQHLS